MACVRDNKAGGRLGKKVSPRLMPPSEGGYKEFTIDSLFSVPANSSKISKKDSELNGLIPIYSSESSNNGIIGYCNHTPHWKVSESTPRYLIFGDHTRTFNIAEKDFCIADNVKVLIPKQIMSVRVLLYIITIWKKAIPNLGYARHWSVAKNVKILLPISRDGNIDFSYIEERVRELEEERVRELEAYLCAAGFSDCSLTLAEREALNKFMGGVVRNKSFEIPSIFHIANTHNILKSDVVFNSGTIPYVTASANNNSVVSYISYKNELIERGNSIMIGGKTLVITYQPMDFFSNDSHNLVLRIKDKGGQSESCALFAVTALYKSLLPKYSWGDSISKQKIQNDKVYLPVTDNGSIDYSFMETYISAVKKQVIGRLKDFIAHEKDVYLRAIS